MEQPVKYYRNPDEPISLEDLKSFLWGAATRLRGQIDAAGYKEYIFLGIMLSILSLPCNATFNAANGVAPVVAST